MEKASVPAAQYLRMSTDHQQYSLDNQADAIARYAMQHGFKIVETYSDAARSGLRIKNRPGLKQLLRNVVDGGFEFKAVLVYDVSRWGRFQDVDEAAHYEYLCKSAGVPVHYCAESFLNDNSMSALIAKALKRTMAGEYSRELSVKVRAGQFRLAQLGYKLGGYPPYGLSRQLLDVHGRPKQILADGERKSLANEHVTLITGPPQEVAVIKRIFHEFVNEHRSMRSIARRLNESHTPFLRAAKWEPNTILHALERSAYVGTHIWGRTTAFLSSPVKRLPEEQWAICPNAFKPIISQELFDKAQEAIANLSWRLTDEQLLEKLKVVLQKHGKLNARIIQDSRLCPGHTVYQRRFGGLLKVYALLGYAAPESRRQATSRQRAIVVRCEIIKKFVDAFQGRIEEFRPNPRRRALLKYRRTGLLISIVLARLCPTAKAKLRWFIESPKDERKRLTIVAFMDANTEVIELRVFRQMDYPRLSVYVTSEHTWLRSGILIEHVPDLLEVVSRVREKRDIVEND